MLGSAPQTSAAALPSVQKSNQVIVGAYNDQHFGAPAGQFEQPMEAFEAWLGYPTSSLHSVAFGTGAFDCVGGGTACMSNTGNIYNGSNYWFPNSRQGVTWTIPLTGCDHAVNLVGNTQCTTGHTIQLSGSNSIASGFEDTVFNTVISTIAGAWPNAVLRIGHEMNLGGTSWTWAVGGSGGGDSSGTQYVAAFQHVAGLVHAYNAAHGTHLLIDWCPNIGAGSAPAENFYPGDSYVDIIGMDFYDYSNQTFAYYQSTISHGLGWHASYAATHNKQMAYDECGCGGTDSSDANCANIVTNMAGWMRTNPVRYFDFWNSQSDITLSKQICDNGTAGTCGSPYLNPLSAAAFLAAFSL